MFTTHMKQEGNTLLVPKDTFKYNRYYQIMCHAENAMHVGQNSMRIKTQKQQSKVNLQVEPANFGIADTTQFTFTVSKQLEREEDGLFCEFFQRLDGSDVRIDDIYRDVEFTKESEEIMVILHMQQKDSQSENVQVQAFCKNQDRSVQYIKTITVFLKKQVEISEEVEVVEKEASLANYIDPRGIAIFGSTMNDGQKIHLFQEMIDQINEALRDRSQSQEELAMLTKQVVSMIPSALIINPQKVSALHRDMEQIVTEQLIGDQSPSWIDADSLTTEAFEHLTEAASLLIQEDKLSQASLMQAIQVGLLRSSGEINTQRDLVIETDNFGVSALRFNTENENNISLNVESTGESAQVMIRGKLPIDELKDVILSSALYRELLWDFGRDYNPIAIQINAHEVEDSGTNMSVKPITVKDLEEPILFKLPMDEGVSLTCAYLDEIANQWQALRCPYESYGDSIATCCTTHLSKFALVPTEYLQVITGEATPIETPLYTTRYLIGCVIALSIMVVLLCCLARQILFLRSEKKLYQSINSQVRASDLHTENDFATEEKQTGRQTTTGLMNAPATARPE